MEKKTYPAKYPVNVGFSRSVVVGDYIFVSGCSGQTLETFHVSSNDVEEQTEVAMEKIRGAVEEAGAAMENIVKVVIYFKDMKDYEAVKQAEYDYWKGYAPALCEEPPASTVCQVAALSKPNMLIEFDITALLVSPE